MTNEDDNINYKSTVVNKKLSDHNLILFNMNMVKTLKSEKKMNPYDNSVYEYDTMVEGPEWDNFLEYVNDFDDSETEEMDSEEYLNAMYERINSGCELFLQKKRQFHSNHEKVKKKFIPLR